MDDIQEDVKRHPEAYPCTAGMTEINSALFNGRQSRSRDGKRACSECRQAFERLFREELEAVISESHRERPV
jgi:hypothetical protein